MTQNAKEWDGQERRQSPRLRLLLDQIGEGIAEIRRDLTTQSVQMAEMREDLDGLKSVGRTVDSIKSTK